MVFEFYLAVWYVKSVVNFKNSHFPNFSNADTKLVLNGKNWVGKIPHKWYFAKNNQIIPNQTSLCDNKPYPNFAPKVVFYKAYHQYKLCF